MTRSKKHPVQNSQPLEDRALKAAAQFFGKELLPEMGITGTVKRTAPTEQVYLELKDFNEDFNYEMTDGTWTHLEFESDSITVEDLRRFRAYEAVISYHYGVEVTTWVLCSSHAKELRSELTQGINTYHVRIIRMKDKDAGKIIHDLERKQSNSQLVRHELLHLLLTPLMGGEMPQSERITRSIRILQNEQEHLDHEELMRMQAVLYTLAMKFLNKMELNQFKETLNMTYLGQLLMQDGIEQGIEAFILDNLEEGTSTERIIEKLKKRFRLTETQARDYLEKYTPDPDILP